MEFVADFDQIYRGIGVVVLLLAGVGVVFPGVVGDVYRDFVRLRSVEDAV